jgi:hypothetical protein
MTQRRPVTEVHRKRRQASKELNLAVTDWRVVKLATALVNYDAIQVRLASNELVATDEIVKAEALVAEARVSAEPPPTVNLKICQRLTGICPHCKAEVDLGPLPPLDSKSPSEPPKPSPPVSGPPAASASTSTLSASPKPSSSGAKVVPITDYASARDVHTKQTSQVND